MFRAVVTELPCAAYFFLFFLSLFCGFFQTGTLPPLVAVPAARNLCFLHLDFPPWSGLTVSHLPLLYLTASPDSDKCHTMLPSLRMSARLAARTSSSAPSRIALAFVPTRSFAASTRPHARDEFAKKKSHTSSKSTADASISATQQSASQAAQAPLSSSSSGVAGTPISKPVQISYNPPNKGASGGGSITLNLPPNLMEAMSRKKAGPPAKSSSARAKAQASKALRETLLQPNTGEVFAWATAYSYSFSELIRSGRLPSNYRIFEDNEVIHIPQWPIPTSSSSSSPSSPAATGASSSPSSSPSNGSGRGEIFIFRSGSYVTWGLDQEQSGRFLRSVIQGRDLQYQVEVGRYAQIGDEAMDYLYASSQPTRVQGDIIVIGQAPKSFDAENENGDATASSTPSDAAEDLHDDTSAVAMASSGSSASASTASTSGSGSATTPYTSFGTEWTPALARLAFSQGLARSARLSVQESSLSRFLTTVSSIPSQLETVGKVPLSRTSVIKHMGTLLRLRQTANLDRDNFYDEPEVYWENSRLEDHYRSICHELDISQRFETLNEKLDHCENLLGVVRALLTESTTHRMELIIIALIAFEATLALISHDWLPTPSNIADWYSAMSSHFAPSSAPSPAPVSPAAATAAAPSVAQLEPAPVTNSHTHQV
ncbi:hypothetical protein BCV70DRAFT_196739 [Testicularia cyperi]|uniref:DUF155 domain-containing protein n=1 Tax=Testicularia cyperi TaxID=1882483 RepID=A0A317XW11_9BASI|nr:hypothetical protein BCV70DRAFT_196739 [Testicularia cyperi]